MKIGFLGDSITEGVHGISYVDMIQKKFPQHHIENFGKGGDTIKSLYTRAKHIPNLSDFDLLFLFIGVNDVMGQMSKTHKENKELSHQPITENVNEFMNEYQKTIDYLMTKVDKLVVISPTTLGEDINNQWNNILQKFVVVIEKLISQYPHIDYINARKAFFDDLKDKTISDYIPMSVSDIAKDGVDVRAGKDVDEISKRRGLHLTMDGTHINTKGAQIISGLIIDYLNTLVLH